MPSSAPSAQIQQVNYGSSMGVSSKEILIATIIGVPCSYVFDTAALRYMLDHPQRDTHESNDRSLTYKSEWHAMVRIMSEEGVRGFFRAGTLSVTSGLLQLTVAVYLDQILDQVALRNEYQRKFLKSYVTTTTSELLSYPLTVLSNRIIKSYPDRHEHGIVENYQIAKREHGGAVAGLFRGCQIGLIRNMLYFVSGYPGSIVKALADFYPEYQYQQKKKEDIAPFLLKIVAVSLVTLPLDMVQLRLQTTDRETYTGFMDCVKQIYKNEGLKGFYKGTLFYPAFNVVSRR